MLTMSYTVSTDIKRNSEAEKKGEKMEAKEERAKEKGEAKKGKDHEKKKEKDYEKRDYERKGLSLCVVAVGITVDGPQMLLSSLCLTSSITAALNCISARLRDMFLWMKWAVCEIDLQLVEYR